MSRVAIRWIPISAWPAGLPVTRSRKHGPFRATWTDTLALLDKELHQVKARAVEVLVDCPVVDIRKDGQPKADARVRTPGVVLRFDRPLAAGSGHVERLEYPSDQYVDWQDNVRAIALTLEALRAVDRYGVTAHGQQYAGFRALPSSSTTLTPQGAAEVLARFCDVSAAVLYASPLQLISAYRVARNRTHPDRTGGDHTHFNAVERAKDTLARHHGVSL